MFTGYEFRDFNHYFMQGCNTSFSCNLICILQQLPDQLVTGNMIFEG
jgi:hypothetical protein